jgi:hypothetical protein
MRQAIEHTASLRFNPPTTPFWCKSCYGPYRINDSMPLVSVGKRAMRPASSLRHLEQVGFDMTNETMAYLLLALLATVSVPVIAVQWHRRKRDKLRRRGIKRYEKRYVRPSPDTTE